MDLDPNPFDRYASLSSIKTIPRRILSNSNSKLISILLTALTSFSAPASASQIDGINKCSSLNFAYDNSFSEPPLSILQINFHEISAGNAAKDTIILIHGMNSNLATWASVTARLSANHRVIVYDQRGHGASAAAGTKYTNSTMAGDLDSLMTHLNIDRATIIGHSLGGRTAIKFADLFPNRVENLIVSDMHIRGEAVDFDAGIRRADQLKAMPKSFSHQSEAIAELDRIFGPENASWSRVIGAKMSQGEDGRWSFDINPAVGELYETYALYENLAPSLRRARAPILFIRAEDGANGTAILRTEHAIQIRDIRPDATIIKIDGADHSVHKSHPMEFIQTVEAFLAKEN